MAEAVDPFDAPLPPRGKAANPEPTKVEQVAPEFDPVKPATKAKAKKVQAPKSKAATVKPVDQPVPDPVVTPDQMPEPEPAQDMAADEPVFDVQDTTPSTDPTPVTERDQPQPRSNPKAKQKRQPAAPTPTSEAKPDIPQRDAQQGQKQETKQDENEGMKDLLEVLKETRGLMVAILAENAQIKQQLSDIISNGLTIKWQ